MRHIHFIGIGGVGMNGLAQLAAKSGFCVTGSDRACDSGTAVFQCLETLGVRIHLQDGSGINSKTSAVVFSTAIEPDNPDLKAASRLGIPLLHRAAFLKELIGQAQLIAVAGTAGKTTTTGMLGWIFEQLKKNPSVYNGAAVLNWKSGASPGNVRTGDSNLWIIEADESDRSFLQFHPTHSIITNISKDHYELDELNRMFDQFEAQTSGTTIRGAALPPAAVDLPLLGAHNLENARCALALCEKLGLNMAYVHAALAQFKGIERRLEIVGETDGIAVIDDYAHNPAKIAASLAAVSERFKTVHAFWRPHGFSPLKQGMDGFFAAFSEQWQRHGGSLFILPVYYAGGTVERSTSAEVLVERLRSAGVPAELTPDYETLQRQLEQRAKPGDAILGMGARDPRLPLFAQHLVSQWKKS